MASEQLNKVLEIIRSVPAAKPDTTVGQMRGAMEKVAEILVRAVRMKPTGHHLLEGRSTHDRSMYQIGG